MQPERRSHGWWGRSQPGSLSKLNGSMNWTHSLPRATLLSQGRSWFVCSTHKDSSIQSSRKLCVCRLSRMMSRISSKSETCSWSPGLMTRMLARTRRQTSRTHNTSVWRLPDWHWREQCLTTAWSWSMTRRSWCKTKASIWRFHSSRTAGISWSSSTTLRPAATLKASTQS